MEEVKNNGDVKTRLIASLHIVFPLIIYKKYI